MHFSLIELEKMDRPTFNLCCLLCVSGHYRDGLLEDLVIGESSWFAVPGSIISFIFDTEEGIYTY